jgi:hypothetical protein
VLKPKQFSVGPWG